jgi:hypothetical protein
VLATSLAWCLVSTIHATPGSASLDRAETCTLELTADGTARSGFFPAGFIRGRQVPTLQAGFNMWPESIGLGDYLNTPPPPPGELTARGIDENRGFHYFCSQFPASTLSDRFRASFLRNKDKARPAPDPLDTARFGLLFPAANHPDGKPERNHQNYVNAFDPGTRRYLLDHAADYTRIASQPVPHRPSGNAIHLWGMDNEWEGAPDYSPAARAAFIPWLEKNYDNNIDALNQAWRSRHRTFADAVRATPLPAPQDHAANPGLYLDFMTFQTENFTSLLADTAAAMHNADPLRRGVILKSTQQTIEMPIVNRARTFDHARFADLMRPVSGGYYGIDMYGHGDRQAYETSFIQNCITPPDRTPVPGSARPYGLMYGETNNHDGPGHQFASTFWRVLGSGGVKGAMFFTTGFPGAKSDWDKFGFFAADTGRPKAKFFYAARWASMLHRTERFWTEAAPALAPGLPRVALLVPRRDILLSPPSPAHESRWAYGRNNRLLVFSWLRALGYWVDLIPETKLDPRYLAPCQALFLIGATHLADAECDAIRAYAAGSGILVTDTHPGRYDEHHRLRPRLDDLLGLAHSPLPATPETPASRQTTLTLRAAAHTLAASGARDLTAGAATRVLARATDNRPAALLNASARGRVLHFPFELGSLTITKTGASGHLPGFIPDGPTADSGERLPYTEEFVFARWLSPLLAQAGLTPACSPAGKWTENFGRLRIESPVTDTHGNLAVSISNRALSGQEILPPQTIRLPLPAGAPRSNALWASAENHALVELPVRHLEKNLHELTLPHVESAGILYFLRAHDPLLGIAPITAADGAAGFAIDGCTPQVKPGQPVRLRIHFINTTGNPLGPGQLRGISPAGWRLDPPVLDTPPLAAGIRWEGNATLTPSTDDSQLRPDWLHPVVFRWRDAAAPETEPDRAILSTHFEALPAPEKTLRLLTPNSSYPPQSYPHLAKTGATYRYDTLAPLAIHDPVRPADKWPAGQALTNGYAYGGRQGGRQDSIHDTGVYARYDTREIAIEFDLKSVRTVRKAIIVIGPGPVQPGQIRVFTAAPGDPEPVKKWTHQADVPLRAVNLEVETPLFDTRARHVRIELAWPLPGGTLSEIELWGN